MHAVELLGRAWEALTRRIDSFLFGCALALVGVGVFLISLVSACTVCLVGCWLSGVERGGWQGGEAGCIVVLTPCFVRHLPPRSARGGNGGRDR